MYQSAPQQKANSSSLSPQTLSNDLVSATNAMTLGSHVASGPPPRGPPDHLDALCKMSEVWLQQIRSKQVEDVARLREAEMQTYELQRATRESVAEKNRLEEERKLLEARNKSIELDLQLQSVDDWQLECAVCLGAPSRYAVVPCGHYALCTVCSEEYHSGAATCPICRGPVNGLLKIFIPAKQT